MSFAIRPFHPGDIPALYRICLHTADSGKDATYFFDDPDLVGHIYAAPYVIFEPELCFILTKAEQPLGYILGTKSSPVFSAWCEREWFPVLRQRYPLHSKTGSALQQRLVELMHLGHQIHPDFDAYPAHLHIDILPKGQGGGNGRKLMRKFLLKLGELHVTAVHLQVGKSNPGAIKFYQHLGFHEIKNDEKSVAFGMHLSN